VHWPVLEGGEDQRADFAAPDEGAAAASAEEIAEVEVLTADALAKVPVEVSAKLFAEPSTDIKVIVVPAVWTAVTRSCLFEHLW
jgi:hypothetical protein